MIHIYGIKNCNTVKKTLKAFEAQGAEFTFHDFKKEPPSESKIMEWSDKIGLDRLINRRGTTWRKLDDSKKNEVENNAEISHILQENTSLIKRPVIESNYGTTVGFDEKVLKNHLNS